MWVKSVLFGANCRATSTASSRLKWVTCGSRRSASRISTSSPCKRSMLSGGISFTSVQYATLPTRKPRIGIGPCHSRIGVDRRAPAPRTAHQRLADRAENQLRHAAGRETAAPRDRTRRRTTGEWPAPLPARSKSASRARGTWGRSADRPTRTSGPHGHGYTPRRESVRSPPAATASSTPGGVSIRRLPCRQSEHDRTPGPLVLGVRAGAGLAPAADPRDAVGSPRPQEDQLARRCLWCGVSWARPAIVKMGNPRGTGEIRYCV